MFDSIPLVTVMPVVLIVFVVLLIITLGYVKAPPDMAFIVSGMKKAPRILIGRAGVKIPFFERLDKLYLGQMTVDIKTEQSVPTNDFINVNVDAVAKVRIAPTADGIEKAAKNFLNKNSKQITLDLQDSLQGNMREIIGTLSLKEINTDRDSFSDQVMQKASKDMDKLGIEILSCNIQNVTDENGLIKDLGADNTALIKKNASIARAQAERDVAIAQAEADKASNEARVLANTEIEQKNNELAIRKAELKILSDTKQAEADAAYEIQKQEQKKTIEIATVNAQIAKAERDAKLREQEVLIKTQQLEADINRKADADKYRIEKEAEADFIRRQKEAEVRRYEMEQEAVGIEAKGRAEAKAIELKGVAEAEAMEKKAEAYQKYNKVAMAEMMIQVLPQVAEQVAKPLTQIDKITIIGGGAESTIDSVAGNVTTVMAKLFESMREATGVDLKEIMRAETYDAKVNKNINVSGIPEINVSTGEANANPADAGVLHSTENGNPSSPNDKTL